MNNYDLRNTENGTTYFRDDRSVKVSHFDM